MVKTYIILKEFVFFFYPGMRKYHFTFYVMLVLPKISSAITKQHGLVASDIPQECIFGTLYGRVQQGPQDL